jgi:hypothetical protein
VHVFEQDGVEVFLGFLPQRRGDAEKALTASIAAKNAKSARKSFHGFQFALFCDLCGRKLFLLCVSAPLR